MVRTKCQESFSATNLEVADRRLFAEIGLSSVDWKDAFGWWCTCTSVAFIWPQVFRSFRHDTTQGISPLGCVYAIVGSNVWFFYSFWQHIPAGYAANVAFTAAQSLIAYVLIRHAKMSWAYFLSFFAASVLISVVSYGISIDVLGWAAIIMSVTGAVPQFAHVVKTHDLHGLSVPSLSILVTSCVSWFLYGFFINEVYYWIPQVLFIPMNSFILWKAHTWHSRNRSGILERVTGIEPA